jgi:hypothetical protein
VAPRVLGAGPSATLIAAELINSRLKPLEE